MRLELTWLLVACLAAAMVCLMDSLLLKFWKKPGQRRVRLRQPQGESQQGRRPPPA